VGCRGVGRLRVLILLDLAQKTFFKMAANAYLETLAEYGFEGGFVKEALGGPFGKRAEFFRQEFVEQSVHALFDALFDALDPTGFFGLEDHGAQDLVFE
jgi:hypothetical protein